MTSILEGELADMVADALEEHRIPTDIAVIRTVTTPASTPWDSGDPVSETYSCRGWVENYDDDAIDGTVIDARDVRMVVLTNSIAIVPTDATDEITLDSKTYRVINVKQDASGALYLIQARA